MEKPRILADGRVVLTLKTAWADGARPLLFEPLELQNLSMRMRRWGHEISEERLLGRSTRGTPGS